MTAQKVIIAGYDVVTPYGWGVDRCWEGLLSGKSAIRRLDRFPADEFHSANAAVIPGLKVAKGQSFVMQMLKPLLEKGKASIPEDAFLILATTTGEIDYLERQFSGDEDNAEKSLPDRLLEKIKSLTGIKGRGMVVSSACTSSSAAIAAASGLIASGKNDCALVVACDSVSDFVFSGFSSLMALDKEEARPFDRDRGGLTVGEAAGYMLLMGEERALRDKAEVLGNVEGWGMSCDANHITGPSRDGSGLRRAIEKALKVSCRKPGEIGSICAHGTGTVYNDSMEIKAFKSVFMDKPIPVYSVKGGTGHTMGAAGLVEAVITLRSLNEGLVPATVNTKNVDAEAVGWVHREAIGSTADYAVSTNSGFGGVNSAIVFSKGRL